MTFFCEKQKRIFHFLSIWQCISNTVSQIQLNIASLKTPSINFLQIRNSFSTQVQVKWVLLLLEGIIVGQTIAAILKHRTLFNNYRVQDLICKNQLWRPVKLHNLHQNYITVCGVFLIKSRTQIFLFVSVSGTLPWHECTVYKKLDAAIAAMCVGETKYSLIK